MPSLLRLANLSAVELHPFLTRGSAGRRRSGCRRAGVLGAAGLAALVLPALAHAGVTAAFGAASYKPGDTAFLHVTGLSGRATLQLFASGPGDLGPLDLAPVDDARVVQGTTIPVHDGPTRARARRRSIARWSSASSAGSHAPTGRSTSSRTRTSSGCRAVATSRGSTT